MPTAAAANKMNASIGVPVKLLYEAEGMKITVEMKSGDIYRGLLVTAEDTMNVSLADVLKTARNGQVTKLPSSIYLKGTAIRLVALPDLLKQAPLFGAVTTQKRKLEAKLAAAQGQSSRSSSNKKRKMGD